VGSFLDLSKNGKVLLDQIRDSRLDFGMNFPGAQGRFYS
jgi:hypothetical protein